MAGAVAAPPQPAEPGGATVSPQLHAARAVPAAARGPALPRRGGLVLVPTLAAALLVALIAGVAWGAVAIPPSTVVAVVARHLGVNAISVTWTPAQEAIVWQLRLPRVLASALVGAALATSGALFQGLFRNPMADPYILGISAGAAFAAVVALTVEQALAGAAMAPFVGVAGHGLVPLAAFAGALCAGAVVLSIARRGAQLPIADVLLAGFAVSALLGAGTTLLLVLNDRLLLRLRAVFAWMAGGVSVAGWGQLGLAVPLILFGLVAALLLARWLDAFILGEEGAATIGVPVEPAKRLAIAVAALLTAAAVTLSGLVGFVGLLVPHAIRLIAGPSHATLIPAAALGGAAFLVLADLLARTVIAPTEVPVGVLTAVIGGPAFLVLLKRTRRGAG